MCSTGAAKFCAASPRRVALKSSQAREDPTFQSEITTMLAIGFIASLCPLAGNRQVLQIHHKAALARPVGLALEPYTAHKTKRQGGWVKMSSVQTNRALIRPLPSRC